MTAQAGDTFSLKCTQRRELRQLRTSIALEERRRAAVAAAHHARRWLMAHRCRNVALYLSAGSELDTVPLRSLLLASGCRIWIPIVMPGNGMRFVAFKADSTLRRNRLGILEPVRKRSRIAKNRLDAILLPLVGYDRQGRRLGAGGGYYDRWLASLQTSRRPLRAGYAYACQRVEAVPADTWDVPLHAVITEEGIQTWPTG